MKNLFFDHLEATRQLLISFSESFIGNALNSTNLGSAREALTSNFLVRNLPSAIEYPSGELFDADGNRSGQIDLIILPTSSPKLHLFGAITLAPVDTVLGVIEVKSTLTTGGEKSELAIALAHCAKLKKVKRRDPIEIEFLGHRAYFRSCPYVLIAYKGGTADAVFHQLEKTELPLEDLPDLIVVLEHNYSFAKNESWRYAQATVDLSYGRQAGKSALFELYSFVIGLVDYWTTHPSDFHLPLRDYVETLATLDFLED